MGEVGRLDGLLAVAFDAVGTLITPNPSVGEVYQSIGRRYGSRLTPEEIGVRFRTAFCTEDEIDRAAGWRTNPAREVDRWRRIVSAVLDDAADPAACFAELWDHFSRPTSWRSLPGVETALAELANRGLKIGVASNFDARLRAVAAGLRELGAIGPIVVSAEVGWRKPAAEYFAVLVRAFDCRPEEVLLVGDDYENDYVGATTAGVRAVLIGADGSSVASIRHLAQLLPIATGARQI